MTTGPGLSVVEEFVETQDRTRVFLRAWRPAAVRAVVVGVHDTGSDSARYRDLAEVLALHGIATWAVDLRGCGRSAGSRRDVPIDRHGLDVAAMVSRARQCDPAAPLFMLGHGNGAVIACRYAAQHEGALDGIVCEAIVLAPAWAVAVARKQPWLSGALGWVGNTLFRIQPQMRKPLARLSLPLLLLHGSEDPVASPVHSQRLHMLAGSPDRTLQVFEGYDHQLVEGSGHALVRDKICQWIEAQLESRSRRSRIGIEYINE